MARHFAESRQRIYAGLRKSGAFTPACFCRIIFAEVRDQPPQKEPVMADEPSPPTGEPVSEVISRAEYASLQEELRLARADRDRQAFEKGEIVTRANSFARDRDEMANKLAIANAERDRLATENNAIAARAAAAETRAGALSDRVAAAEAENAGLRAEIVGLRAEIASAPPKQPLELLWLVISEETRAAVVWIRSGIPADSPILPWYDKTIETVTRIGCEAIRLAKAFFLWAKPHAIELFRRGKAELETRLGKK
jgi:hypothetical protein